MNIAIQTPDDFLTFVLWIVVFFALVFGTCYWAGYGWARGRYKALFKTQKEYQLELAKKEEEFFS